MPHPQSANFVKSVNPKAKLLRLAGNSNKTTDWEFKELQFHAVKMLQWKFLRVKHRFMSQDMETQLGFNAQ